MKKKNKLEQTFPTFRGCSTMGSATDFHSVDDSSILFIRSLLDWRNWNTRHI